MLYEETIKVDCQKSRMIYIALCNYILELNRKENKCDCNFTVKEVQDVAEEFAEIQRKNGW